MPTLTSWKCSPDDDWLLLSAPRCAVALSGVRGVVHHAVGRRVQPHVPRALSFKQCHRWAQAKCLCCCLHCAFRYERPLPLLPSQSKILQLWKNKKNPGAPRLSHPHLAITIFHCNFLFLWHKDCMINSPLAREKWTSSFLISQQQCSNYPSPARTAITTAPAPAPFAASSHPFSRGKLKTCNAEKSFFCVNPESRRRLENQRKDLLLLINKTETEKGSNNGTEQLQEWSGTCISLRTTVLGWFCAQSELGAPHHMNFSKRSSTMWWSAPSLLWGFSWLKPPLSRIYTSSQSALWALLHGLLWQKEFLQ